MARQNPDLWYSVGRLLGPAIDSMSERSTRAGSSESDRDGDRARAPERPEESADALIGLVAGGLTAVVVSGLRRFTHGRRPSASRLARGALAGAGAAGVVMAARFLLDRRPPDAVGDPREVSDELLAGAGRGLIYTALLDPFLPGPPVLRGALAGTADYLALPLGGLFSRLQTLSPVRRTPVLSILLEIGDAEDERLLHFLGYGAVLGLLLGDDGG